MLFRALILCVCAALLTPCALTQKTSATKQSSVAIVVDNSIMDKLQWQQLRDNVDAFLAAFNGEDDEVALFTAGGPPVKAEDFTSDARRVSARLQQIAPQGSPALYSALREALQYLSSQANHDLTAIVTFVAATDHSGDAEVQKLLAAAGDRKPALYFVGLPGSDWREQQRLQQLSASTGGSAYFPSNADQLREVSSVLGRQLASGSTQLTADPQLNRKKPLAGYRRVLVHNITANQSKRVDDPQGNEAVLRTMLISQLKREHLFDEVIDASREQPFTTVADASDTVSLLPTLLEYRKGSRVQRQFIGWKGEARYVLQVSLFNAATRQPVVAFVEKGTSASGVFGGSDDIVHAKARDRVIDKIVDDLKHAK
jgi:hypothetical protein